MTYSYNPVKRKSVVHIINPATDEAWCKVERGTKRTYRRVENIPYDSMRRVCSNCLGVIPSGAERKAGLAINRSLRPSPPAPYEEESTTEKPDGGRAFPCSPHNGGMTLRDYFAIEIMNGFLCQPMGEDDSDTWVALSEAAYACADAMIAEREKGNTK